MLIEKLPAFGVSWRVCVCGNRRHSLVSNPLKVERKRPKRRSRRPRVARRMEESTRVVIGVRSGPFHYLPLAPPKTRGRQSDNFDDEMRLRFFGGVPS